MRRIRVGRFGGGSGGAAGSAGSAASSGAGGFGRAKTDTGFDDACSPQPSLTGSVPNDELVFFKETSYAACACCGDGWVTSVSVRNGLTVFGGRVLAAGPQTGKDYPTTWEPASDLVLPNALAKKQYIFDAVVLRHLGSGQDNGFPDLIVLVNSGWLARHTTSGPE